MDDEKLLSAPIKDLPTSLKTSQSGLSFEEAKNRLEIYGPNELAARKRRTGIVELLYHLRNPLMLILLLAGLITVISC
jgi:Mg2+-importing ATPase